MEPSDSEEGSEIEELEEERLLELGRADNIQGPLSQDLEQRYEKLKAQSFGSHVNTKLDTLENRSSTLETEESKGPSSPRIGKQEAGGDAAHANEVHLVDNKESLSKVAHGDAAKKKASFSIAHTSSLKLLQAHQQEASDSMDPSPPVGGCSCFFLSSKWGEMKKQKKKKPLKGEGSRGSNHHKDKTEQEEKIEEEWASISTKNVEGGVEEWDAHASATSPPAHYYAH